MPRDYAALLKEYGFSENDPELANTTLAFLHEIYNTLDDKSVFLTERTEVREQPDNPDQMLSCELVCAQDADLEKAVNYFFNQWVTCLRYYRSVYEAVEVFREDAVATIHCITISEGTACSFKFTIFPNAETQVARSTLPEPATYNDTGVTVDEWRRTGGLTPEQQEDFINGMSATFDDPDWPEKFLKKLKKFRGESE